MPYPEIIRFLSPLSVAQTRTDGGAASRIPADVMTTSTVGGVAANPKTAVASASLNGVRKGQDSEKQECDQNNFFHNF